MGFISRPRDCTKVFKMSPSAPRLKRAATSQFGALPGFFSSTRRLRICVCFEITHNKTFFKLIRNVLVNKKTPKKQDSQVYGFDRFILLHKRLKFNSMRGGGEIAFILTLQIRRLLCQLLIGSPS